ncbi:MAG TPA: DUF1127 domain-containing protein [Bauldia sp.]|nr:DUF1127 domain-containing protein [Bauldia sp.]
MATYDDTRPGAERVLPFPFIASMLQHAISVVKAARNRRQVARLLSWDARMLRDIGLTPGDVRSAMASPLGDDPSGRLGAMAEERRNAIHAAARERLERERRARSSG